MHVNFQGYAKILQLLVEFSAKSNPALKMINSVNSKGSTALHIAVETNNGRLLRYLLTR
jgi:ankyrin repeat protein